VRRSARRINLRAASMSKAARKIAIRWADAAQLGLCHTSFEFTILSPDTRYSTRRAIIGSTLVARRAGK
jgi:hypothetical protein